MKRKKERILLIISSLLFLTGGCAWLGVIIWVPNIQDTNDAEYIQAEKPFYLKFESYDSRDHWEIRHYSTSESVNVYVMDGCNFFCYMQGKPFNFYNNLSPIEEYFVQIEPDPDSECLLKQIFVVYEVESFWTILTWVSHKVDYRSFGSLISYISCGGIVFIAICVNLIQKKLNSPK